YAMGVINGSCAIHLAMCALDLKRGDKILCSVNSFVSIPEAVRHFDSEPIFVDCVDSNYNIDLDKLEVAISLNKSKKLKAIVVNHLSGDTTDLDRLYAIAKANDLKVIEDATDAMGATFNGKRIGNSGADITIFSFAPYLVNSSVKAAMLVTNDEILYERAKLIANHGILKDEWDSYGNVDYLYDIIDIGWDYTLGEMDAFIALSLFKNLQKNIKRRVEIATIYNQELANVNHVSIPKFDSNQVFSQYIIQIAKNRDHFAKELKARGVNVALHYIPLHLLDYYKKKYALKVFDFPTALSVYQKVMSLPIHPSMSDKDVMSVCEAIKEVASKHI
ncbi:MAG: aminotransferase class I/II-fold pyridoxal phosphate-dependent enzyme, partial [Campylobacterales bacterium]|nr:aminotransferase class I/II-fold pyridoxal phosphate-dependent enzyme [Campylobacterales bacterium]